MTYGAMMFFTLLVLFLRLLPLFHVCGASKAVDVETKLLVDIMTGYDTRVRPVQKPSDALQSSLGVSFKALLQLDEKQEFMETVFYMLTAWHDLRLTWNSSDYLGVDTVKLPASQVWRPDFIPFTSIDENVQLMDTMAVVISSGHVRWIPTIRLRSPCKVNLKYFPYDQQICTIKFASYVHHGFQLNLSYWGGTPKSAFDTQDYTINANWELKDHRVLIKVVKHQCCKEPYPHLQIDLFFKRNPTFYLHLFVWPAVLLGALVPISLLLPPESRERLTVGSMLLLAEIILHVKLTDILPMSHSETPTLSVYYTLTQLWTVLSLLMSVLVLNLHNRGPRRGKIPEPIRWIFLRSLKRLVCLGSDSYYPLNDHDAISMRGLDKTATTNERTAHTETRGATSTKLEKDMEDLSRNVGHLSGRLTVQDVRQDTLSEWRQVALVLDRVLFLLFFVVFLLCTVILLG